MRSTRSAASRKSRRKQTVSYRMKSAVDKEHAAGSLGDIDRRKKVVHCKQIVVVGMSVRRPVKSDMRSMVRVLDGDVWVLFRYQ